MADIRETPPGACFSGGLTAVFNVYIWRKVVDSSVNAYKIMTYLSFPFGEVTGSSNLCF
jgi:hypothetical protein